MTEPDPRHNYVDLPPAGLVLALQYWEGDEVQAMRLARLLADIEPARRDDVTLALCRRYDIPQSALWWQTFLHCGRKFGVVDLVSRREGTGHPHGCNELAAGILDQLADAWAAGNVPRHSVFLMEADGVPLRADWIERLGAEHEVTLAAGKRVTGCMTALPLAHVNGSLIAHLSLWHDRPSLRRTPSGQAWDLFHAAVLNAEARPTTFIKNVYGGRDWSAPALAAMGRETAWMANAKDDSAIAWAERTLAAPALGRFGGEEE